MKVAYYSPLPPERSGIADYSALLLPALSERVDLQVVKRGSKRVPRGTDIALYHIGNNPEAHGWILEALHRWPGIVVLHEFVLHHLVAGITVGVGDGPGYLDAMQRDAGIVGRSLAHAAIDGLLPPIWDSHAHDFPLADSALDFAKGLIVHSKYVEHKAREAGYRGPIWRIPMPAWPDAPTEPATDAPEASPLIGTIGNLNASKRIPELLTAFVQLRRTHPEARLLLAGSISRALNVEELLLPLGLEPGKDVFIRGYVPEEELWALMAACDICVSLRSPTMGETSSSAIRTLSLGRPLVVSDVGWFSELPDDVVAKVPVDELEAEMLASVLERLASDASLRTRLGAAAREYALREHDLDHAADLYVAALEEVAGHDAVRDELLGEVSQAAAEVGIDPYGEELAEVGERIWESGLGR